MQARSRTSCAYTPGHSTWWSASCRPPAGTRPHSTRCTRGKTSLSVHFSVLRPPGRRKKGQTGAAAMVRLDIDQSARAGEEQDEAVTLGGLSSRRPEESPECWHQSGTSCSSSSPSSPVRHVLHPQAHENLTAIGVSGGACKLRRCGISHM